MSTLAQRSFSGGELTPSLYVRSDINKYITALRTCRNYYVLKHGGAKQRPGTVFVGEQNDHSSTAVLFPFVFNSSQSYVLEFGDGYIRFIKDGAYIYNTAKNITGITQANPGVVTSNAHGYSNGDEVYISGVIGMDELNGRSFKVAGVTANTFNLQDMDGVNFNTTSLTAYSSGGTCAEIYQVSTSFSLLNNLYSEVRHTQSADVFSFCYGSLVYELSRISDTNWLLEEVDTSRTTPSDNAFYSDVELSGFSISPAPTGTPTRKYGITAVDLNGRESLLHTDGTDLSNNNSSPSGGSPNTLNWSSNDEAAYYKVYVTNSSTGKYAFLAETATSDYEDDGSVTPDPSHRAPPSNADVEYIPTADGYKAWDVITSGEGDSIYAEVVAYYQQRFVIASGEEVRLSQIGNFKQFEIGGDRNLTDASPVSFTLAGRTVNDIKHIVDLNGLVLFGSESEIVAQGDSAGTITPTQINLRTQSYYGSGNLPPVIIDNHAIFLQARGSTVRDFSYDDRANGYTGNDLSIFSTHLFEGYTLTDWTYQKNPSSIIWAVRSDGVLLGLTYLKEHEVLAWHRHDFDGGTVESVCSISEGSEDYLYLIIKRTIDGKTRRYIERMSTSFVDDIKDVIRMDSTISYDGRHTGSTTMTLSGGTTWAYDETVTLTASASTFSSSYVGNQIHLTGSDGSIIRFSITGYTSATVVTGKPNKTIPVAMRSVAISTWAYAVDRVEGLWHLEGKDVSILADGFVVASPYNESYDTVTVADGAIDLDNHYSVIHVGLPYIADLETLDIDTSQGETGRDKKHLVSEVSMFVEKTRGLWVGPKSPGDNSVDNLYEVKVRNEESMDSPVDLKTEVIDVKINTEWNSNGRVFIRQIDPVPSTILSIMPKGNFTLR